MEHHLGQIGQNIDEPCTQFLGVQIDEFLSWNFQLKQINKKISRALFAVKQVKHEDCVLFYDSSPSNLWHTSLGKC